MKVWFILVISVRSAGPWEGSAIKSGLWLGLFNTVSVKWLKVNGTLTQSDRNCSCSRSNCCCIKVGLIHRSDAALDKRCFVHLQETMNVGFSTARRERCLSSDEVITLSLKISVLQSVVHRERYLSRVKTRALFPSGNTSSASQRKLPAPVFFGRVLKKSS